MNEFDLRLRDLDVGALRDDARLDLMREAEDAIRSASSRISYFGALAEPDLDELLFYSLQLASAVNILRQIKDNDRRASSGHESETH